MVHDCGGIAVLAHPGAACNKARLAALQVLGLDGAEVLHPSHSAEDRRRLLEAVTALGMLPSGGSDSHGASEGSRVVGSMQVPLEWLHRRSARRCVAMGTGSRR
jgi:predicted metal-dependent phosphoesterase TrpH